MVKSDYSEDSNWNKIIITQKENQIKRLESRIVELESHLTAIEASRSWKLTKPLRNSTQWIKQNVLSTTAVQWMKGLRTKGSSATEAEEITPDLSTDMPEACVEPSSSLSYNKRDEANVRTDVSTFVHDLLAYDIISFDVFDTLILHVFDNPADVFRLLAHRSGEEGFSTLRKQAAVDASNRCENECASAVNIYEIYDVLEDYLRIDKQSMIHMEMDAEKDCCFANPFMKKVFDALREANKEIIIVSDHYFPADFMVQLLESCGYSGFSKLYISCDYRCTKHSGKLYQQVASDYSPDTKFVHIGNDHIADVLRAEENGWKAVPYQACREIQPDLTAQDMNRLSISAYNGIINSYFGAEQTSFTPAYEYGFRYFGFLIAGFCEWLNTFAENNHIDKILFLARDADIIHKVYNRNYKKFPNEYVVISRLATWIMSFESDTEAFIKYFFESRANLGTQTIGTALEETDMEDLIPMLEEYGLKAEDLLSKDNYMRFRNFIYHNKDAIINHYADSIEAGQNYFKSVIGDAKRVCAVDIGWSGQILITMRKIIRELYHGEVSVQGAYFALISSEASTGYVEAQIITPWLYHECLNQNIAIRHACAAGDMQAKFIEATLTSSQPTLLKYTKQADADFGFLYGIPSADEALVSQIQEGILAFVEMWNKQTQKLYPHIHIMPTDAKRILDKAIMNYEYCNEILGSVREWEFALPNFKGSETITTLSEILKKNDLIR